MSGQKFRLVTRSDFDGVVVLDLRDEEVIYPGNRFMIYALNPGCTLSVHLLRGLRQQNTVFAVGKSIVNRASNFNIGELMLRYNGGRHENAGTCQVENERADTVQEELVAAMATFTPIPSMPERVPATMH